MSRRMVIFGLIILVAIAIYQVSHIFGIIVVAILVVTYLIRGANRLGKPIVYGGIVIPCTTTFFVEVEVCDKTLDVPLKVTTFGDIRESLLVDFSLKEYWSSILTPSLKGWTDPDSLRIIHMIERIVQDHVNQFNYSVAGGIHNSSMEVRVGRPILQST